MSSSSSSSQDFSGPCPENGFYDVFLSFRGKDTRYGFTANLYQSLKNNKIYSFMDIKNLGYDINRLFEMVAMSKVALVVFSENFADSAWCLKELKMILQRREEKKMLIIPIFYNIDVDELKHLTGKTAKYLDEHIQKHGETTVNEWKTAVITLGYVSGLSYKIAQGRYEFEFIADVIAKTKEKLEEWEQTLESTSNKPYYSSPATEYDVFISFMGEDTRYCLVNHLYEALMIRNGMRTFMDDRDLSKDDNIFDVIQRSKIAVVVFSKNYASSKWCLRELVKILQCRNNTMGQLVVLPIFYEITPTDLINQAATRGSMIACQLEEHVLDHEEAITVQSWRDSISELGYMDGWPYSTAHSKRAEFIGVLVEEISTILSRLAEKKESTRNQQACRVSAKEENTQALAVQKDTQIEKDLVSDKNIKKGLKVPQEDKCSSTGDEEVYRIVTSAYFQKLAMDRRGELIIIKPSWLIFYVELEKPSSSWLTLENKTDKHVAFMIKDITPTVAQPKYLSINPNMGVLLPRSKCQVQVTKKAQTVLPSYRPFLQIHSVKAKKYKYSTYDISNLFKGMLSRFSIYKDLVTALYVAPPPGDSSVPEPLGQSFAKMGFSQYKCVCVHSIDTHPTKPWLLLAFNSGWVSIWNYETRAEEKSFIFDDWGKGYANFIHEKPWIVVGGSKRGLVLVFNYNTFEKVKEFKAHEDSLRFFKVHPISPYVLTTSNDDKLVKLWNWENDWACNETFEGHSRGVQDVAFNPKDSRSFASASQDGTIKIWSFGSSVVKFTINAHAKELMSVDYFVGSDNKLYLLCGSWDNTVRIWDYASKTLVQTLEGHSGGIRTILVHPKLPIIITGSQDKTIHIWNKNTHRWKLVWTSDLGGVYSIRFIQASDEVVLGCEEGMVVIKIVDAVGTQLD